MTNSEQISEIRRQLLELVKINIGSYVPPKGLTTENTAEEFERLLRLEKELSDAETHSAEAD